MKKIILLIVIFLLAALGAAVYIENASQEDDPSGEFVVKKPAIYIYPEENMLVNVNLILNGNLTKDIPKYNDGWTVFVTKDGRIDGKYDYLFYEASLNELKLPETGWIVEYNDIEEWLDENLVKMGLNEKEKMQFKEYWLPALPAAKYYEIKLLEDSFLKENMDLLIFPKPDTTLRLNFHFRPLNESIDIPAPVIITPNRTGFTVVEWGGVLGI